MIFVDSAPDLAYNSGVWSVFWNFIMKSRLLKVSKHYSFFLFGARGTGKSTLLRALFEEKNAFWIDLLDPEQEAQFSRDPNLLKRIVLGLPSEKTHVILDEVQKVPALLDIVHGLIEQLNLEKKSLFFVLTGSSARKLKRGGANLLAGRAFVYHLYPFSFLELEGAEFSLEGALQYGSLPKLLELKDDDDRKKFLQAYAHTYLKEEIMTEQWIKNLDPFRRFLEMAGQMNGKIINYRRIAQDVGVDEKTVQNYYSILEDTLLGFFLEAFHHSFRKRLSQKPKFFFFDLGVVHSLTRTLSLSVMPQTSYYGELFEQFVILEIYKLCQYFKSEYRLSYLQTKDDFEIDLVIDRPGETLLLIEIKSARQFQESMLTVFRKIREDFPEAEKVLLSQDPYEQLIEDVKVLPWRVGLERYFI